MVKLEKGIESGSTRLLSFAVVMLMVFFSAGVLQGAIVEYTVVVTDMSSVELAKDGSGNYIVSPGQNFLAEVWVDDLRADVGAAGGVFAAYADLVYDVDEMDWVITGPASPEPQATIVVDSFFANAQSGTINEPSQLVDEAGGFDGFTAPGADPARLLFTVQGVVHNDATFDSIITIQTESADVSPTHDTLVFGSNDAVQDIAYGSATLVPEPMTLSLLAMAGIAALCRRRRQ